MSGDAISNIDYRTKYSQNNHCLIMQTINYTFKKLQKVKVFSFSFSNQVG